MIPSYWNMIMIWHLRHYMLNANVKIIAHHITQRVSNCNHNPHSIWVTFKMGVPKCCICEIFKLSISLRIRLISCFYITVLVHNCCCSVFPMFPVEVSSLSLPGSRRCCMSYQCHWEDVIVWKLIFVICHHVILLL